MLSIPLIFEIDVYLRHMKWIRNWSFDTALWRFVTYWFIFTVWMIQTYDPPPWFQKGVFPLMMNIFLAYNLIFDAFLLPVDWTIITKELSMEFFQMLKSNAGSDDDDVSLGLVD